MTDYWDLSFRLNIASRMLYQVLLVDVPQDLIHRMWFMHIDGAPLHFCAAARFPNKRVGHGDPTSWPAHSPDHVPLDFQLQGHLNVTVYAKPIENKFVTSVGEKYVSICLGFGRE